MTRVTSGTKRRVHGNGWVPVKEAEELPIGTDFSSLTVAQLRAYADENGIDLSNASKKAEILEAIEHA